MRFDLELLLRILVGTLLGGVIGYERDIHGRPAGLRTHTLVALASSTFMVVSTHFVYAQHYGHDDPVAVDPSRIAASVVSGIGFLAGGAILRTGLTVQGLTTAAGLWLVAAIGLASGGGMYPEAVIATVVGIAALTLLRRFEDKDDREMLRRRLTVTLGPGAPDPHALMARLQGQEIAVTLLGFEKDLAGGTTRLSLEALVARARGEVHLLAALEREPELVQFELATRAS